MQILADRTLQVKASDFELWLPAVEALMLKLLLDSDKNKTVGAGTASEAAKYHIQLGGQRIRARLALSACANLGVQETDAIALGTCVELIHNASLVHDDLQDKDSERRGAPAVWSKFGHDAAICAGDLLISAAYAALAQVKCTSLLPVFLTLIHTHIASAIKGQCADLSLDKKQLSDLQTYQSIAIEKSGALLSMPLELALVAGGASDWASKAREAAHDFAVAYQIYDDIQDIKKDSEDNGTVNANVLILLKADPTCKDALETAIQLGTSKLEQVIVISADLPMNSGYLLTELAKNLHHQLQLARV